MIVRRRHNWFRMLWIWNGSVLPVILPRLFIVFLISTFVVYFQGRFFDLKIPLNPTPFTLMGIALAIFVGFRNSAGYERFWEGRKLWGALLNDARSFMRQAVTHTTLAPDSPAIDEAKNLIIALLIALRHQLRDTDASSELKTLLSAQAYEQTIAKRYRAAYLLRTLGDWIHERRMQGELSDGALYGLDLSLMRISDSLGGCERIAGTPIPYPYTVLLHRTVYIYCFLLPFGLVDNIAWATPLVSVFISYTFMALDEVVNQIEDPFGSEDNDLPLEALCEVIEVSVREIAGENDVKIKQRPVNYRLS